MARTRVQRRAHAGPDGRHTKAGGIDQRPGTTKPESTGNAGAKPRPTRAAPRHHPGGQTSRSWFSTLRAPSVPRPGV